MTLTEFLLARIAEDEAAARVADPSPWVAVDGYVTTPDEPDANYYGGLWDNEGAESLSMSDETAEHVARHQPARVLAECEAKRRIVADLENWRSTAGDEPNASLEVAAHGIAKGLEIASRLLALPYADHPDYQQEWRP